MKFWTFILILFWCSSSWAHDHRYVILAFEDGYSRAEKSAFLEGSSDIQEFSHIPSLDFSIAKLKQDDAENWNQVKARLESANEIIFVGYYHFISGSGAIGTINEVTVFLKNPDDINFLESDLLQNTFPAQIRSIESNRFDAKIIKLVIEGGDAEACASFLRRFDWVDHAEPNYLIHPQVNTTNDLYLDRQWALDNTGSVLQGNGTPGADMSVFDAWTVTTGDPNTRIAILDSGTDTLHVDLVGNMGPGFDALGDSTHGYPTPNFPNDGHGTCCAGISAAVADNNEGVAGVCYDCTIIPIRGFHYVNIPGFNDPQPLGTSWSFADGITWAWEVADAAVVSNSWSLPPYIIGLLPGGITRVEKAIDSAWVNGRNGLGLPCLFSSGNEDTFVNWPGTLPNAIAVNATTMCDERKMPVDCSPESWWGSNYGEHSEISAPGVRVTTTDMTGSDGYNSGDYSFSFNGTSAACPNAAGVFGLVYSVNPSLSATAARHIVRSTCDKVGGYAYDSLFISGTWSYDLGYGRVNAYAAVQAAAVYNGNLVVQDIRVWNVLGLYPSDQNFTVRNISDMESLDVRVFNTLGQVVKEFTLGPGEEILVPTDGWHPGQYLFKTEVDGVGYVKRGLVR